MKHLKFTLFLLSSFLAINFSNAQSVDDGKKMMYYEKFISAKNVFQQLVTANPNDDVAVYWLGQSLIGPDEDKDVAGARAVYEKGLAANPNSALLNAGMGHVELLEGKTQQARSHFETAISLNDRKNPVDVLDAVGFANGDFDSKLGDAAYAVEKLKQATGTRRFKDAKVMTDLGDAYRKLGDGGNAQLSYEEALKMDPNYARAKFRIGRIYQSQGRSQEAIYLKYYNEAIALDPAYTRVYFYLYQYFYETDVTRSGEYLNRYLNAKGETDEPRYCFMRAQMKFAEGLFAEALTATELCIASKPNPYPNLYGVKAYAAFKLGDSAAAKSAFDMYFKKQQPDKIGVRDAITYAAVLLKFPDNEALATTYIEKAVALDTTEEGKVSHLKSIAAIYEGKKEYGKAADWYKKIAAIKKTPSKTDIYNAGIGYYRVGMYNEAIEMFDLYSINFPDDIFGYYYKGGAQAGIDTTMELGLSFPTYTKAVEVGEAYTDKSKIMTLLKGSYRFLIIYAANILKDKEMALGYCDKVLLLDPADEEYISIRESVSKMSDKKPDPPKKK